MIPSATRPEPSLAVDVGSRDWDIGANLKAACEIMQKEKLP